MQLFDELRMACADPKRKLFLYGDSIEERVLVKRLADGLTRATRFEMDDDFTRVCAAATLLEPAQTASLAQVSMPPFETMWIEWDEHVKVQHCNKIQGPIQRDAPRRIGFLIERETKLSFPCYRVWVGLGVTVDGLAPGLSPIGYLLIPDAMTDPALVLVNPQDKEFNEVLTDTSSTDKDATVGLFGALLLGWGYLNQLQGVTVHMKSNVVAEVELPKREIAFLNEVVMRARVIRGGYMGERCLQMYRNRPVHIREDFIDMSIRESNGTFRWLITILGMMNTYQTVASSYQLPSSASLGPRPLNLRKVPFLEFRRLSVKLPVAKPIAELIKPMRLSQIRKRAHQVRGHYRLYRKLNKRVWVKQHQRGDASLGFVHKEYLIESGLDKGA